jgi:hypothetical protein
MRRGAKGASATRMAKAAIAIPIAMVIPIRMGMVARIVGRVRVGAVHAEAAEAKGAERTADTRFFALQHGV